MSTTEYPTDTANADRLATLMLELKKAGREELESFAPFEKVHPILGMQISEEDLDSDEEWVVLGHSDPYRPHRQGHGTVITHVRLHRCSGEWEELNTHVVPPGSGADSVLGALADFLSDVLDEEDHS